MLFVLVVFALISALVGAALSWLAEPDQPGKLPKQSNNCSTKAISLSQPALQANAESNDDSTNIEVGPLIEHINNLLPQSQCAQCGYPGCRPYATAIINDDAPINQCPPGGESLIADLADYLGKQFIPLDSERGEFKPPQVATIDESECIGCTLCIASCPVDAIVGASRFMHTVISEQCTGCELCLPPCPVDCIDLKPAAVPLNQWRWPNPV